MIIERTKHLVVKTEAAIEKIRLILESIEGEFVDCVNHKSKIRGVYRDWQEFSERAVSFGMLLPLERDYATAPIKYWKTGKLPTIKIVADPRAKAKPKQGDGSVLAPKFNHAISKPEDSKPEIYRTERVRSSKLPIISRNEDERAYDTNYQLERLEQIRMARL